MRIATALVALVLGLLAHPASAQDEPRLYAGAIFGVATLSADAQAVTTAEGATVSLYEPSNGPALNVFAGFHLTDYVTLQGNWIWNRNDLTLLSSFTGPPTGGYYEQRRNSRHHMFVADLLIYFRELESALRPYLGTGVSVASISSDEVDRSGTPGLAVPGAIASTRIGLRSHVGIDFAVSRRLAFRYSFSETISSNPIGASLTPPGRRALMNFQNLFGFIASF